MFFRLQLLTLNFATAILLIFFLCLGSQNLGKKYSLDFLINKTVSLPIGFLVGTSFTIGIVSGGLTSVLMMNNNDKN
jgi:cell division protein FtsX